MPLGNSGRDSLESIILLFPASGAAFNQPLSTLLSPMGEVTSREAVAFSKGPLLPTSGKGQG